MSIYKRWILWLGQRRWFAVLGRRFGSRLDRRLYRASDGKLTSLGRRTVPVLLLTTTGRRSRRERTVPVMYIRDGTSFVISSENFGQRHPAAWPLNLDAYPAAKVQVGAEIVPCSARLLMTARPIATGRDSFERGPPTRHIGGAAASATPSC